MKVPSRCRGKKRFARDRSRGRNYATLFAFRSGTWGGWALGVEHKKETTERREGGGELYVRACVRWERPGARKGGGRGSAEYLLDITVHTLDIKY